MLLASEDIKQKQNERTAASPPSHYVPVPDRPTRLCGRKATLNQTGSVARFQARSKDLEILEEGGGAGPSALPRRDHE